MNSEAVVPGLATAAALVLLVFGVGFLVANIRLIADLMLYQIRKRSAVLVWEALKPRYHGFNLALGVACGLLVAIKVFYLRRPIEQLFGEGMMFVYYGYAYPLSTRIARGFYRDGIWSDRGFMPWAKISAVSWKEEEGRVTLVLISRGRQVTRGLVVPGRLYGQVRRVLLDRIKAHDIHIGGTGLDLGSRDETDGI
jgi:hypothetical protein